MYHQPMYSATAYPPPIAQTNSFDQRYSPLGTTTTSLPPVGITQTIPGGNPMQTVQSVPAPVIPQSQYLAPPTMAQNVGYAGSVSPVVPQMQMAAPVVGGYGITYSNVGGHGGAYYGAGYGGGYTGGPSQYLTSSRQNNPSVIVIDNGRRRHRSHSHGRHHHRHHGHSHSHSHSRSLGRYGYDGYSRALPLEYPGYHSGLRRTRSYESF
ncbi:hypothetical protein L218DRAFT_283516 [Marasmius fiardii PR-910]|nr:hypothetical protein L218DRAFT_283516 [Marasmius fiardii PR-910]